jgi:hypothetical protein
MAFVVMLIEFGPLDEGSASLYDTAHIAARGEQLARDMDRSIARRATGAIAPVQRKQHATSFRQAPGWVCSCFVCIDEPSNARGIPAPGVRPTGEMRTYHTVEAHGDDRADHCSAGDVPPWRSRAGSRA